MAGCNKKPMVIIRDIVLPETNTKGLFIISYTVAHFIMRTYDVKKVFSEKNRFDYFFDVTKCPEQIEIPALLHMSV